jgi:hypothetical protein
MQSLFRHEQETLYSRRSKRKNIQVRAIRPSTEVNGGASVFWKLYYAGACDGSSAPPLFVGYFDEVPQGVILKTTC